jgi:hypothetical protein
VLNRGLEISVPSMQQNKITELAIPSYAILNLVTEIRETLHELNSKLEPIAYLCKKNRIQISKVEDFQIFAWSNCSHL